MKKQFIGEVIGTFIIVFLGCGAVATAVLFNAFSSLYEIAIIWGLAVALAVFCSRNLSPAHLNPAVTAAILFAKGVDFKTALFYVAAQLVGAMLAAFILLAIFNPSITQYEIANGLTRGETGSHVSAMMFGEFFPNPGFPDISLSWWQAMIVEATGTFVLVFSIFSVTEQDKVHRDMVPILVGGTVTLAIVLFAPFTQCGINPARDFGPRLVAAIGGWGIEAFPKPTFSFFTVYIMGPLLGGIAASYIFGLTRKN